MYAVGPFFLDVVVLNSPIYTTDREWILVLRIQEDIIAKAMGLRSKVITTENPVANIITSNVMCSPMSGLVNRWSMNVNILPLFVRIPFSVILEIPSKFGVKLGCDRAER
jgi:hypothetical protein